MMRAVDLHHLAKTVAPPARLVQPALTFTARRPDSSLRHPFAQRLLADRELMPFDQLLAGKRWTEVEVVLTDQFQREVANAIDDAIVGTPATRLVPESCSAIRLERLQQTLDLTN